MGEEKKGKEVRMNELFDLPILEDQVQSPVVRHLRKITKVFDFPVSWVRENIVERYRGPQYYYYHQKFNRVPTIDQCYTDDQACILEANEQFKRDKKVDENIVNIVRHRYLNCVYYERGVNEYYNHDKLCPKERADYKEAELNYFIKYGDLGNFSHVVGAFYKLKHRLIWERRQQEKLNNQQNA